MEEQIKKLEREKDELQEALVQVQSLLKLYLRFKHMGEGYVEMSLETIKTALQKTKH